MKKQPKNKVLFLIPVGVILAGAVIFLCTRGNENDSVCKENVARLQALENSDISQTEEQLQAFVTLFGNNINHIPETEPDEIDKAMIQDSKQPAFLPVLMLQTVPDLPC